MSEKSDRASSGTRTLMVILGTLAVLVGIIQSGGHYHDQFKGEYAPGFTADRAGEAVQILDGLRTLVIGFGLIGIALLWSIRDRLKR